MKLFLGIVVVMLVYLYVSKTLAAILALGLLYVSGPQGATNSAADTSKVVRGELRTYFLNKFATREHLMELDMSIQKGDPLPPRFSDLKDLKNFKKITNEMILREVKIKLTHELYRQLITLIHDLDYRREDIEYIAANGIAEESNELVEAFYKTGPGWSREEVVAKLPGLLRLVSVGRNILIDNLVNMFVPFFDTLRPWQVRKYKQDLVNGDIRNVPVLTLINTSVIEYISAMYKENWKQHIVSRLWRILLQCKGTQVSQQYRFPLCWMMSSISLLDNVRTKGSFTLHPDVDAFIDEWKGKLKSDMDPREPSCPLIQPASLRKHAMRTLQSRLDKVIVTVNKDERMGFGYPCIDNGKKASNQHALQYVNDTEGLIEQLLTTHVLSRHKTTPPLQASLPVFDKVDSVDFTASFDDPVVQDYMEGKEWLYNHPVCVSRFTGGDAFDMTYALLSYENTDIKKIDSLVHRPSNGANTIYFYTSPVHSAPIDMDSWKSTTFVENGYELFGGNIRFSNDSMGHAVCYVTCATGIVFIDTNTDVPFESLDLLLRGYGKQTEFAYTMILKSIAQ